jgi:hypothetical protein
VCLAKNKSPAGNTRFKVGSSVLQGFTRDERSDQKNVQILDLVAVYPSVCYPNPAQRSSYSHNHNNSEILITGEYVRNPLVPHNFSKVGVTLIRSDGCTYRNFYLGFCLFKFLLDPPKRQLTKKVERWATFLFL